MPKFYLSSGCVCVCIYIYVFETTLESIVSTQCTLYDGYLMSNPLAIQMSILKPANRYDQRRGMHTLTLQNPIWQLSHHNSGRIHFTN